MLENGEHWERCGFFIESNEYSASAARTIESMRRDPELWFRSRIGTDTYGTKTGPNKIPLLQVGDFGAFLAARYIGNAPEGRISWKPFYEKLKDAGRIYRFIQADERSLQVLHETHEELKAGRANDGA